MQCDEATPSSHYQARVASAVDPKRLIQERRGKAPHQSRGRSPAAPLPWKPPMSLSRHTRVTGSHRKPIRFSATRR